MGYTDEFTIIAKAQKERDRQVDYDDHNNALRGTDVGRDLRFLSPEAHEAVNGDRKAKKGLDPLELALLSAEYAQMYNLVLDGNRDAQNAITDLGDRIDLLMDKVNERIDQTLDKAVTLPDGRKVFMHEDGKVYTSDDKPVDPVHVAGIDWTDRPTYNEYRALLIDRDRLQEIRDENDQNSLRLGEIRDDLENRDNPLSQNQLQSHKKEQETIGDRTDELKGRVSQIEERYDENREPSQSSPSQSIAVAPKAEGLNF
ncbi:hypothetical protein FDK21_18030 [Cohaesibacter sp. CAU 1516]|uniref:hypothetical protein n=1 Tax=Cohaesibacter sp. CAU 1516 TaxID=2576038 RepID=UPI0010FD5CFE|nr:hypothetical protein [Cohaesibacter sp. CAU 1516]TLP43450.1 hypothetical protein FDK21_18030 [Cohaesibacter sp. CAU 1516]